MTRRGLAASLAVGCLMGAALVATTIMVPVRDYVAPAAYIEANQRALFAKVDADYQAWKAQESGAPAPSPDLLAKAVMPPRPAPDEYVPVPGSGWRLEWRTSLKQPRSAVNDVRVEWWVVHVAQTALVLLGGALLTWVVSRERWPRAEAGA